MVLLLYCQKKAEEQANAKGAYEVFYYFHNQWKEIAEASQKVQQRDYPLILESLKEVVPLIMQEGHYSTQKFFIEYVMVIRKLAGYVRNGDMGLTSSPEKELENLLTKQKQN